MERNHRVASDQVVPDIWSLWIVIKLNVSSSRAFYEFFWWWSAAWHDLAAVGVVLCWNKAGSLLHKKNPENTDGCVNAAGSTIVTYFCRKILIRISGSSGLDPGSMSAERCHHFLLMTLLPKKKFCIANSFAIAHFDRLWCAFCITLSGNCNNAYELYLRRLDELFPLVALWSSGCCFGVLSWFPGNIPFRIYVSEESLAGTSHYDLPWQFYLFRSNSGYIQTSLLKLVKFGLPSSSTERHPDRRCCVPFIVICSLHQIPDGIYQETILKYSAGTEGIILGILVSRYFVGKTLLQHKTAIWVVDMKYKKLLVIWQQQWRRLVLPAVENHQRKQQGDT